MYLKEDRTPGKCIHALQALGFSENVNKHE